MVRSYAGWTLAEWAEVRMWASCTLFWVMIMAFYRFVGHLDLFRLFLFLSPGWITSIWAPFQKDREVYRLVSYMIVMFLAYWITIHSFPVQCRHAWGTMMVGDKSFWGNETAIKDAILEEKEMFYVMNHVNELPREVYWPLHASNKSHPTPIETHRNNVDTLYKLLSQERIPGAPAADPQVSDRIQRWMESWTGGLSFDLLQLRAYCHIHQDDALLPHIYPLRTLGVLPDQVNITMPCPYWSCVMTEARTDGKLPFFATLAAAVVLNYFHYRCDCLPGHYCQWLFGTGQCRIWWAWFWATLLPLWCVMLIKTTLDMELLDVISMVILAIENKFHEIVNTAWEEAVVSILGIAGLIACYYYRDRIKRELGLDDSWFIPLIFPRSAVPDDHQTFQVCIWRVDVHADRADQAERADMSPSGREDGSPMNDLASYRSLMVAAGPVAANPSRALLCCAGGRASAADQAMARAAAQAGGGGGGGWNFRQYLPMMPRVVDRAGLKTADGSIPSLCVRFYYNGEEIQSTRVVRPTSSEWNSSGVVYFQETFRLNIEWKPRIPLKVEIRDASAPLGHTTLGHCAFDENALVQEFELSQGVQQESPWHSVPVMQVVRMLEPAGNSPQDEAFQIKQLRQLGFAPHRLSEGGAVWLAFCEIESGQNQNSFF